MRETPERRRERAWSSILRVVKRAKAPMTLRELADATGISVANLQFLTQGAVTQYPDLIAGARDSRHRGRPYVYARPEVLHAAIPLSVSGDRDAE